jgi:putative redox protein
MSTEIAIRAVHQGEMRFRADSGRHTVDMDYPLAGGDGVGMRPLELLLSSLAACAGSTLALLLTRMRQPFTALEVEARGQRRDEHPTVITDIALEFIVRGAVERERAEQALAQAEERLCPVWAMLRGGTPITSSLTIHPE